MTLYSIFEKPQGMAAKNRVPVVVPPVAVADRFSWFAALFPPVFALFNGLWLLLVFWVFKLFFRVGWVVVALLLAAGVASALQRPATALVEQVYSGDEGQTTSAPDGKSILDVPKPSPRAVAFVGTWLVSFVLLQMTVGAALRATRKKR